MSWHDDVGKAMTPLEHKKRIIAKFWPDRHTSRGKRATIRIMIAGAKSDRAPKKRFLT